MFALANREENFLKQIFTFEYLFDVYLTNYINVDTISTTHVSEQFVIFNNISNVLYKKRIIVPIHLQLYVDNVLQVIIIKFESI